MSSLKISSVLLCCAVLGLAAAAASSAAEPAGPIVFQDPFEALVTVNGVQYTQPAVFGNVAGQPGGSIRGTATLVDGKEGHALQLSGDAIEGETRALCANAAPVAPAAKAASAPKLAAKADLSSLSSMLKARWKGDAPDPKAAPEALAEGQIRTFTITKIDPETKRIEVELRPGS